MIWKEHFKVVAFIFNVDIDLHKIYGVPIKKTTEISNLFGTYPNLKIIIDVKDYDYIGFSRFLIERKKLTFIDHWCISQLFMYDKIDVPILWELPVSHDDKQKIIRRMLKNRKGFLMFGNCQTIVLKKYLLSNERFNKNYLLLDIPAIHQLQKSKYKRLEEGYIYVYIDSLAIMNIKENNKFDYRLSTKAFKNRMNETCKIIVIPNLWFTGYFPQLKNEYPNSCLKQYILDSWFYRFKDAIIEKYKEKGKCAREFIFESENLLTREMIKMNFCDALENVQKMDSTCSFGMADYICREYEKHILFYCPNHPKNYVIKELCTRLLKYMGMYSADENVTYKHEKSIDQLETLRIGTTIIYPGVYRYLGLPEEALRKTDFGIDLPIEFVNFKDYVYLYYFFSDSDIATN